MKKPDDLSKVNVIALTILDKDTFLPDGSVGPQTKMLYGVRTPAANLTHPDVLSMPTQRLPLVIAQDILASGPLTRYAVEHLFARKLGVADALELKHVRFQAKLACVVEGVVDHAHLGYKEETRMINVQVDLECGVRCFPQRTASLDPIGWITVADFIELWKGKDITRIGISAERAFSVCVTGLCVESSYKHLSNVLEGSPKR